MTFLEEVSEGSRGHSGEGERRRLEGGDEGAEEADEVRLDISGDGVVLMMADSNHVLLNSGSGC
jgi:hypothetical protein